MIHRISLIFLTTMQSSHLLVVGLFPPSYPIFLYGVGCIVYPSFALAIGGTVVCFRSCPVPFACPVSGFGLLIVVGSLFLF